MATGSKADMNFLNAFKKSVAGMSGVGTSSKPPRYWYSMGNYCLNRVMSGSFYKGIPQGRVTNLCGPSASGKSFVAANIVKSAQQSGAMVLVVDSENALDDDFMAKIGVDVEDETYTYAGVTTISQTSSVVSSFLKNYRAACGAAEDAPQVLILIDSLDMLLTETEHDNYVKGVQKGDQGQRNKQLKQMLRTFVQDIKDLNVCIVVTSQVYKNQDVTNGEGLWIVSDAVKYSASQICMLTKLKLKEDTTVVGIRMKGEGYKTRFCKPFSTVVVEVPYDVGMDPLSGLVEVAVSLGVLIKRGSRLVIDGEEETWFAKDIGTRADKIIAMCEERGAEQRLISLGEDDEIDDEIDDNARKRRGDKHLVQSDS